jgi:thiol-disulfide isomerase/thioredoxin
MTRVRIRHWTTLAIIVGAWVVTAKADERKGARSPGSIAADLAAAPLPRVDVAAMANPAYAAEFTLRRTAARQRRADLILELYNAAPSETAADLLLERWQTLALDGKATEAVDEMSRYLAGNAGAKEKEAAAFQRAQVIIEQVAKDTAGRLAVIEEFRKFLSAERAGTMLPQLLYRTGRLAPQGPERDRLLARVVQEYPDSSWARVVRGATTRQEAVGKTMEMAFKDAITGTPIDIADFRGKAVVVDFWAAWCTDCAADAPYMKRMYDQYKDKGVTFVGVSLDMPVADGGLDALQVAVARHQFTWPQYYLGREWDSDFSVKWGVFAIPTVFVLDQQGKVVTTEGRGKLETFLPELLRASPK